MKKLLILTGPQGSGNHLMAKIFSTHPEVAGWTALSEKYWVTSISVPFINYGKESAHDLEKFIKKVKSIFMLLKATGLMRRSKRPQDETKPRYR